MAYVAGFHSNMSPYQSFGHNKFIPAISNEVFTKILHSNPLYNDATALYKEVIDDLWPQVEAEVFNIEKPYSVINFPEDGGVTGYFGRNLTKDDLNLVKEFLIHEKIDVLNTRAWKKDGKFTITVGSIKTTGNKSGIEFKGSTFDVVYGEFGPYVEECNNYMREALKYVANDT